jgi:tRNA modification GTPase
MDTIFALASARGKAGVAVVRVSGPDAYTAMGQLSSVAPEPPDRKLVWLRSESGEKLDQALCLSFVGGHSFTGEPVVEFHLHGSVAVLSAVLETLSAIPGLRLAEPGEFTKRALLNDKLDLAQVEGLGDLIEAETEAQRKQAQRVFSGALGQKVEVWRRDLIRAAALIEAVIDFADEEVPEDVTPEVQVLLGATLKDLQTEIIGANAAERIRDGFEVAIVGNPNAGKSTLLNRMAGREAALTSEIAGTTRDVVEVRMDLLGLPVMFLDTAGLRETDDPVEAMGVARARDRAHSSDLRIILTEQGDLPDGIVPEPQDIVVDGKVDQLSGTNEHQVSGVTGQGIDKLIKAVAQRLEVQASGAGLAIRTRHLSAMQGAVEGINAALEKLSGPSGGEDLIAQDIREAVLKLDSVIGRVDVEHVLDEIFASFCLGK